VAQWSSRLEFGDAFLADVDRSGFEVLGDTQVREPDLGEKVRTAGGEDQFRIVGVVLVDKHRADQADHRHLEGVQRPIPAAVLDLDPARGFVPPDEFVDGESGVVAGDAHGLSYNAYLGMVNLIGIDRVLFTTDYPYANMKAARQFLDQMPINPGDKEKIGHLNAERLLKL
jgi:hypothetical protein